VWGGKEGNGSQEGSVGEVLAVGSGREGRWMLWAVVFCCPGGRGAARGFRGGVWKKKVCMVSKDGGSLGCGVLEGFWGLCGGGEEGLGWDGRKEDGGQDQKEKPQTTEKGEQAKETPGRHAGGEKGTGTASTAGAAGTPRKRKKADTCPEGKRQRGTTKAERRKPINRSGEENREDRSEREKKGHAGRRTQRGGSKRPADKSAGHRGMR